MRPFGLPQLALLALPALAAFTPQLREPARAVDDDLPAIAFHDNAVASGTLRDGALSLGFEIRRGMWHPNGKDRPGTPMLAFAEPGKPLSLPGPLIRVPVGTRLLVTVTNTTDSTLVLRGVSTDPADTLVLAPGATGSTRAVAATEGNRFYHLGFRGSASDARRVEDGHLAGAIVVEGPGARAPREHVLVITASFHSRDSTGRLTVDREIFVLNGRPWPHSQRYQGAVGAMMRFRVLNATPDVHPMHLHGAYYRVDSRGTASLDSLYAPERQRMVVTEFMQPSTTMTMSWTPDRPGGWLMHCHFSFHVISNIAFGADSISPDAHFAEVLNGHEGMDPDEHVEHGMGGLMTMIEVPPPPGWRLDRSSRRLIHLEIPDDSIAGDPSPVYAPTVRSGGTSFSPLAPRGPGGPLLLTQHEPTTVRVVNRSKEATAIHWHGMELESLFDGVVGIGGTPGQRTTAIAPRDSFDALMTPPRAGTFIYHTHFLEIKQAAFGLYGAMIILPPGERWDPTRDHYFIAGPTPGPPTLNGAREPAAIEVALGTPQRLRFINITAGNPTLRFSLARADSSVMEWTLHAKDGLDLPPHQQRTVPARQLISMGETYDMMFLPPTAGTYRVELRAGNGRLFASQELRVVDRQPTGGRGAPR